MSSELRADIFLSHRGKQASGCGMHEEERQRARRFVFDRDRDMYVFSHGLLRLLLARYMVADPRELTFASAPGGRPELVSPSSAPIRFRQPQQRRTLLWSKRSGHQMPVVDPADLLDIQPTIGFLREDAAQSPPATCFAQCAPP
ncbi:4'-phosphopantetheinyl transferase family protein [Rhizobium leguminosarum]|uniref:4'-phosphopantetheinyl transferase family protein n=1 Tax=Rhizobium leguminosarum TaxID=384 RepID=UPI0021B0D07C|nr:hypothetical protein [Rhizobium leguminosarum]